MELDKLPLPTDRISKFFAVLGLVGIIAALYLSFKYTFLIQEQAGLDAVKIKAYSTLYRAEFTALPTPALTQIPNMERLSELGLKIAELKVDQDVVDQERSLLHLWQFLGVVFFVPFFAWMMRLGIKWWHSEELLDRMQRTLNDTVRALEQVKPLMNAKCADLSPGKSAGTVSPESEL